MVSGTISVSNALKAIQVSRLYRAPGAKSIVLYGLHNRVDFRLVQGLNFLAFLFLRILESEQYSNVAIHFLCLFIFLLPMRHFLFWKEIYLRLEAGQTFYGPSATLCIRSKFA